ncbi:hypothetical protein PSAB6_150026 [Paraburkholderia sabiae]|nr:hypothetical protein PSAB6_150026 [Paraburkholderia sabiae]
MGYPMCGMCVLPRVWSAGKLRMIRKATALSDALRGPYKKAKISARAVNGLRRAGEGLRVLRCGRCAIA